MNALHYLGYSCWSATRNNNYKLTKDWQILPSETVDKFKMLTKRHIGFWNIFSNFNVTKIELVHLEIENCEVHLFSLPLTANNT